MCILLSEGVLDVKKSILAVLALMGATGASAANVDGFNDVTDNGDGTLTFVFDTIPNPPNDIDGDGSGDGIRFSGFGLDVIAQSDQGIVRQDWPGNGGLGVLGPTIWKPGWARR
jgi:hypothetical protein